MSATVCVSVCLDICSKATMLAPTPVLAVLLGLFALTAADNIRCVPTDENGNEVTDSQGRHYDLSSLRRRPPSKEWVARDMTEKNDYFYTVNVCDRIYSDSHASDTHAAVWQVKRGEQDKVFECGDATTAKITLVEDGALRLTYDEGGHCHRANVNRNTIITLVCKTHVSVNNPPSLIREDNCTYIFQWLTAAACPIDEPTNVSGVLGTILLCLFMAFMGYLCVGTVYRYFVLHKSGSAAIPNGDWWAGWASSVGTCCHWCIAKIICKGWPARRPPGTVDYSGLGTEAESNDSLIIDERDEGDEQLLDA